MKNTEMYFFIDILCNPGINQQCSENRKRLSLYL